MKVVYTYDIKMLLSFDSVTSTKPFYFYLILTLLLSLSLFFFFFFGKWF